jgi:ankyrin repeat protein
MTTRRKILQAASAALATTAEAAEPEETKNAPLDSERFRKAAIAGDLATVVLMLDRDPALLYARDAGGVSIFTLVCIAGQTKIAEELVRRGLVPDIFEATASGNSQRATELAKVDPGVAYHRLPDGRTPLHLATEAGKPDMVTFFATRGADLSAGPQSPLLAAVNHADRAKATEMSQFLLMNASDPNARRRDGKAALHLAAARGYEDLVTMLIHRGADPDVRDSNGKLPLDVAAGDAMAVLRKASTIERAYYGRRYTQDQRGNPVTREDSYGIPQELINQFVSVAHFDFEKVKQLQKLCPLLTMTRATWDELAIEAAAHMGLAPMAQYLADLGAPVSTCTATLLGASGLVKKLVSDDAACLRERGAHDIALLPYVAIGPPRVEIAGFLLDRGADIHSRMFGQTTLHVAAMKGHLDLAGLLLDRGADVNATANVRGAAMTPLAMAVQAKQAKMADLLKARGGRASRNCASRPSGPTAQPALLDAKLTAL